MNSIGRKVIAICTSWEDEENLNLVLGELIGAVEREGGRYLPMCVTFDRSSVEARGEESLSEFMKAFDVPNLAGFLLFGEMIRSDAINRRIIQAAHAKQLPVFMLERQYEGCINMAFNYLQGYESVARHMIEDHGCRRIVMVAGIKGNPFSEARIDLTRSILREHGGDLPAEQVIYGDFWDEPTFRALDAYFSAGGGMPEAFLCVNDAMAIATCVYLDKKGVRVPEAVKVCGFDGILPGQQHEPAITTARPDFEAMFGEMIRRMDTWETKEAARTETLPVPFRFIPRQSCSCAEKEQMPVVQKIGELKMANLDFTRHIRAMGIFIRRTLSMDSVDELTELLSPLFSIWPNPYYFAAVLEKREQARTMMHMQDGLMKETPVLDWKRQPVPDVQAVLTDPAIRILMVQLLQTQTETMGYVVSGIQGWNLREQERFEEEALFLSSALSAVIRNRRLNEANSEILRMAEQDYLTGLYNRRGFLRELERLLVQPENQDRVLTLFSADMDRLKKINDRYGHQEGDHAICCLAEGIRFAVDGKGICARYGGDEFAFAILSGEAPDPGEIRERMIRRAREVCGERDYQISASLGACSCIVREHPPLDELLAESDRDLYAHKGKSRQ